MLGYRNVEGKAAETANPDGILMGLPRRGKIEHLGLWHVLIKFQFKWGRYQLNTESLSDECRWLRH